MIITLMLILHIALCVSLKVKDMKPKDWGYHNKSQIEQITQSLCNNSLWNKKECQNDKRYRYLQMGNSSAPYSAILVCGVHARQLIAAQVCLKWMQDVKDREYLARNYWIRVFYYPNYSREKMLGIYNKESEVSLFDDSRCLRKNINGVDPNRNFPTEFDYDQDDPHSIVYPGKTPLDQPLSKCINQMVLDRTPNIFIDFHSGQMNTVYYYPTAQDNTKKLLKQINLNLDDQDQLDLTTLIEEDDRINGQVYADLTVRLKVKYSMLFEVYGSEDDERCFYFFNPILKQKAHTEEIYSNIINQVFMKVQKKEEKSHIK